MKRQEKINENDSRIVLCISPRHAPIKVSVLPLLKKKHAQEAKRLYNKLSHYMMAQYEETGSIGKRYRRGDAIGIPFAVTVDDDTLEKGIVTVRKFYECYNGIKK